MSGRLSRVEDNRGRGAAFDPVCNVLIDNRLGDETWTRRMARRLLFTHSCCPRSACSACSLARSGVPRSLPPHSRTARASRSGPTGATTPTRAARVCACTFAPSRTRTSPSCGSTPMAGCGCCSRASRGRTTSRAAAATTMSPAATPATRSMSTTTRAWATSLPWSRATPSCTTRSKATTIGTIAPSPTVAYTATRTWRLPIWRSASCPRRTATGTTISHRTTSSGIMTTRGSCATTATRP